MTGPVARLEAAIAAIPPLDRSAQAEAEAELDRKTKPRRSLGRLEELAARLAAIRGQARPGPLEAAIVVAAADHGVAAEGVSAYPSEVTAQMVANFASGGAAICVLAREADARLVLVDVGVREAVAAAGARALRIGPATANSTAGPAMSRDEALRALAAGIELAGEMAAEGVGVVGLGDMGIGNTTAASALTAVLLDADPAAVTGPGTGLDAGRIARKVEVVRRILAANRPDRTDALGTLAAVGGFEIAFLAGLAIGAAGHRLVVILDGFISSVAGLVAARLAPTAGEHLIASHLSPEPGHALILVALGVEPLLDLGLRLGEGTGAALALPLLRAAAAVLAEMATFAEAGVTDAGR